MKTWRISVPVVKVSLAEPATTTEPDGSAVAADDLGLALVDFVVVICPDLVGEMSNESDDPDNFVDSAGVAPGANLEVVVVTIPELRGVEAVHYVRRGIK